MQLESVSFDKYGRNRVIGFFQHELLYLFLQQDYKIKTSLEVFTPAKIIFSSVAKEIIKRF